MEHVQTVGNHLYDAAKSRNVATSVAKAGTLISLTVGLSLPAIGYTVALYMLNFEISRRFPTNIHCSTKNYEQIQSSNTNKIMTYFAVTGSALLFSASPILMILGSFQLELLLSRICKPHLKVTGEKTVPNFCKKSLSKIISASPFIFAFGPNSATFTAITIHKIVHHILPKKVIALEATRSQKQVVIAHNNKISLLTNSIFLVLCFTIIPTLPALTAMSLSSIAYRAMSILHDYATQDSQ